MKICVVEPDGVCAGCGRTLDEIAGWMHFSPDQRRAVNALAQKRQEARERSPQR